MKHSTKAILGLCLALILFACSKSSNSVSMNESQSEMQAKGIQPEGNGVTQLSGIGYYATPGECDFTSQGADYSIRMTGDLEGCLYAFIDQFDCSPSGTYREEGREYFVGTYHGQPGTFWTTYKFEAKYEGCSENGAPLGVEIFGRCQHPVVGGSGTGVFANVTGQLNFKDDIEAGNFPYRGHLRF